MRITFRLATTADDLDIVRRMNNDVFALEIGQHEPAPDGRLVDGLESRSTFLLAFDSEQPAAMVSFHSQPPYSVEGKLADPLVLGALPGPIFEIRLLAVDPGHRGTPVLTLLLVRLFDILRGQGARTVVISGIAARASMYLTMGFRPLGPAVRSGAAEFVPMALDLANLPPRAEAIRRRYTGRTVG